MSRNSRLAPEVNRSVRPPCELCQNSPPTNRTSRALFVKNLSYTVSTEELFDLFGKFGPVRYALHPSLSMRHHSAHQPDHPADIPRTSRQIRQGIAANTKGSAYVVYEDVNDAKSACDRLNGFNFQSRYLVVLYHQPEKMSKTHAAAAASSSQDLADRAEHLEKLKQER
jgi:pre-mRNA branch site protein p14